MKSFSDQIMRQNQDTILRAITLFFFRKSYRLWGNV